MNVFPIYHRYNFHKPDLSTEMTYPISEQESNPHNGNLYFIALQVSIHIYSYHPQVGPYFLGNYSISIVPGGLEVTRSSQRPISSSKPIRVDGIHTVEEYS